MQGKNGEETQQKWKDRQCSMGQAVWCPGNPTKWAANLPTCFREAGDQHAKDCAARTRQTGTVHWARDIFLATWSTRELDGETLALEIAAICYKIGS